LISTLGVFLCVQNDQQALASLAGQLLEVVPDLTPTWELTILDAGSDDATGEIAHELATEYPQINYTSCARGADRAMLMREGLTRSAAELILFRDVASRFEFKELGKLWLLAQAFDVVAARAAAEAPWGRIPPPPNTTGVDATKDHGGLYMVRREALDRWLQAGRGDWLAYFWDHGYTWREVEMSLTSERSRPSLRRLVDSARPGDVSNSPRSRAPSTRQPKFLGSVSDFARGD